MSEQGHVHESPKLTHSPTTLEAVINIHFARCQETMKFDSMQKRQSNIQTTVSSLPFGHSLCSTSIKNKISKKTNQKTAVYRAIENLMGPILAKPHRADS